MRTRKTAAAGAKRVVCTFDGCNRAFTRQEHLQRHSLNHLGGDFTCDRCRAHFRRQDLLDRHEARHRQKDAEGVPLMTRKRSWKDADGNIIAKRPGMGPDIRSQDCSPQLMSPPNSGDSSHSNGDALSQDVLNMVSDPRQWGLQNNTGYDTLPTADNLREQPDGNQQVQDLQENFLADDLFNPDTASSFNMPFTTMSNYNWLFDVNMGSLDEFNTDDINLDEFSAQPSTSSDVTFHDTIADHSDALGHVNHPNQETQIPLELVDMLNPPFIRQTAHALGPPISQGKRSRQLLISNSGARGFSNGVTQEQAQSSAHVPAPQQKRQNTLGAPAAPMASVQVEMERPMSFLSSSTSFPKLDALARSHVLQLIEIMRPLMPDGTYITSDHPLLSMSSLQTYSDLFFSRFNSAYPLLHQATFEPAEVETLLLLSVFLLGATYSEADAHQFAVCIHDVLRPQIFAHSSFSAQPELWILQCTLLTECFGKSRAGRRQHDMSHLFHGLLINLIRRSDCQTVQPEHLDEGKGDLEEDWRAWVEAEQKKRYVSFQHYNGPPAHVNSKLALLCFMWDTQHAVLFCQSLCMSAFELRSTLPCSQSLWEAASAEQWQNLRRGRNTPPSFLTVLKSYLTTPSSAPPTRNLNALSRVLIFHGLMSIAWDMNRRDQTSLGVVSDDLLGNWRLRIGSAYDTWKADFDTYVAAATDQPVSPQHQRGGKEWRKEFAMYRVANSALYHAANVILHSDFLDVQIYAGARHILGRPVGKADYHRSQRVVKRWANEQVSASWKAAWHAAGILREGVIGLDSFDAGGLFIYPWCLYLAAITVWSFHHARPSGRRNGDADLEQEEDEMIWDAKADMVGLLDGMMDGESEGGFASGLTGRGGKARTAGMTAVVVRQLSKVRWAVVRDGMTVLKGLVPWRLISDVEVV